MADVDNNFYQEIGLSLVRDLNDRNHRYLQQQRYYSPSIENPLETVTPLFPEFFGPRVLTILVISRNYGWVQGLFRWPPPGFEASKTTIKEQYTKWVEYKVLIWVDLVLGGKVQEATPDSAYAEQMEAVAEQMDILCAEMGDFGFEYMGTLTEGKDAAFFQPYIEDFWGKKE